jgi:TatD DNase family protein
LTFKNAEELRKIAIMLPEDRLLIETDSPYLTPVPKRGRRNEPAYVKWIAQQLGVLRGTSTEEIANVTGENFRRLFGIPELVG